MSVLRYATKITDPTIIGMKRSLLTPGTKITADTINISIAMTMTTNPDCVFISIRCELLCWKILYRGRTQKLEEDIQTTEYGFLFPNRKRRNETGGGRCSKGDCSNAGRSHSDIKQDGGWFCKECQQPHPWARDDITMLKDKNGGNSLWII